MALRIRLAAIQVIIADWSHVFQCTGQSALLWLRRTRTCATMPPPPMAFSAAPPLPRSRNLPRHINTCRPVFHVVASQSALPDGALPLPVQGSPLEERLTALTFGYEETGRGCAEQCRYRCKRGHVVKGRRGSEACARCPTCFLESCTPEANGSRKRLSMCGLRAVAADRGGALVSTAYSGAKGPLVWRCAEGHLWEATPDNVRRRRSWCPECARLARKSTIGDMRELAECFGGACLSQEYLSEHIKLLWRCANGHVFELAPNNIRRKMNGARKPTWCKVCRRQGVPLPEALVLQ